MDFAAVFSSLRRDSGLSQRQAAQELGISQALLSHYEKGIREPRLEFIEKLCRYYGVSADYLLGMSSARQGGCVPETPGDAAEAAALCFALEALCAGEGGALAEAALQLARQKYRNTPGTGREALRQGLAYYTAKPEASDGKARELLERLKTEVEA